MADLRAACRLLLLIAGTAVLWFTAWLISRAPATRAERRLRLFRTWARFVARTINLRGHIEGTPPPDSLLVANHLSYVDVIVLAALHDATFVAKAEVADWPILGPLCAFVGTVFIRRGRGGDAVTAALAQIEQALARGRLVVVFPEGTSSDGRQVLPFRPALLEAARRCRSGAGCACEAGEPPGAASGRPSRKTRRPPSARPVECHCSTDRPIGWAALSYFTTPGWPPAERAVCWWGDMTLVDHLYRLLQLPEIIVHVTFGAGPADPGMDRKQVALRLQEAVVAARQDHLRHAHAPEAEVRPVAVQ